MVCRPTLFRLKFTMPPQGTKSFAVVLEDKDAITASGFVWIHWLIADLERTVIQENEAKPQLIMYKVQTLGRVN